MTIKSSMDFFRNVSPKAHFLVTFSLLLPSIFFRFQNHHDGYVLITARLFRQAIEGSIKYPFSQYGSLWSGVLGLSAYLFNDALLLIGIRIISVFCYAISIFIAAKIFKVVNEKELPLLANLIVIAGWYFFGPYYGWPSTFILPLILMISLLIAKVLLGTDGFNWKMCVIGISIGLVQLGRAQIGILLLLCILAIEIKFLGLRKTTFTIVGYLTLLSGSALLLQSKSMLKYSLYDQYVFGIKYHVSSDRGATRIPFWTILICIFTFLLLELITNRFLLQLNKFKSLLWIAVNLILLAFIGEFIFSFLLLSEIHWRFIQRLFVGISIGVALFIIYREFLEIRTEKDKKIPKNILKSRTRFTLSLISISVLSQIYPLFSSHHVWYSIIPLLLSAFLYFDSQELLQRRSSTKLLKFAFIMSAIYFSFWQVSNITSNSRPPINQIVFVDSLEKQSLESYLKYADTYIPRNSRLQNFCPDPTIFIVRPDIIPASRVFIWWNKFSQFKEYRAASEEISDFALVCHEDNFQLPEVIQSKHWKLVKTFTPVSNLNLYRSIKTE